MSACKWDEMTASQLYRRHLGLQHVFPLHADWQGESIKFLDCLPVEEKSIFSAPGSINFSKKLKQIEVTCDKNSVLAVKKLKVPGRKTLTAMDFVNGFLKRVPREWWIFGNG